MTLLILIVAMEVTIVAKSLHTVSRTRTKRHSAPRWTIPCGPGHVAVAPGTARRTLQNEGVVMEQFEVITRKAMETKEKVLHLEELYVSTIN